MYRPTSLLALLGAIARTWACVIPDTPLSNNITDKFSIFVQNPAYPVIHDSIMNFRPNGLDYHLVLRPAGNPTGDVLFLQNGYLFAGVNFAVIDLEVSLSLLVDDRGAIVRINFISITKPTTLPRYS